MKRMILQNTAPNGVWVTNEYGREVFIYFSNNSGQVHYRYKIDTISKVKHPGVYLGLDLNGNHYYIHNHYQIGTAAIVKGEDFSLGKSLYVYEEKCSNTPMQVVYKALDHVKRGEQYDFISYNCQTMANDSCNNERKSQDVDKWVGGGILVGLGLILIGAITGSGKR